MTLYANTSATGIVLNPVNLVIGWHFQFPGHCEVTSNELSLNTSGFTGENVLREVLRASVECPVNIVVGWRVYSLCHVEVAPNSRKLKVAEFSPKTRPAGEILRASG